MLIRVIRTTEFSGYAIEIFHHFSTFLAKYLLCFVLFTIVIGTYDLLERQIEQT
jgi:hypothetical protein